ncbi:MAG: Ig domain-containing protein [Abditibacteriota bacterium]|nr:Ig domain-containing protein [Abditibacteriota bacterium]
MKKNGTRYKKRLVFALVLVMVLATAVCAITWHGATTITGATEQSNKSYSSNTADQNALLINTDEDVRINSPKVTKTGNSSNTDNCALYGINSAILLTDKACNTSITGGTVNTSARGAFGVFKYGGYYNSGQGIYETAITAKGDYSGGVATGGNGSLYAELLDVLTKGNNSPAIFDLGSSTHTSGIYETCGSESPAVYNAFGETEVSESELYTSSSSAVVIEGRNYDFPLIFDYNHWMYCSNTVSLWDCYVEGNHGVLAGKETKNTNVLIYNRDENKGVPICFNMLGGKMVCDAGSMFHVTNANAFIGLGNANLANSADKVLLDVSADSWGASGKNGGHVTLYAQCSNEPFGWPGSPRTVSGEIKVDSLSSLYFFIGPKQSSKIDYTYSGKINTGGRAGKVEVQMDLSWGSECRWKLTGDSYIDALYFDDPDCIDLNGHDLYINGNLYKRGCVTGVWIEQPNDYDFMYDSGEYRYVWDDSERQYTVLLYEGQTARMSAYVMPNFAENKKVKWTSGNKNVATVSSSSKITAVGAGTTYITVKTEDGGLTDKCKVTVRRKVAVTGISLNKSALTLLKGKSDTLTATVKPSKATDKGVKWTSGNKNVATVSSSGKIKARKAGSTVITATTKDGGYTAKCKVTVKDKVPVTGVSLNKTEVTLSKGGMVSLSATVKPSGATNKEVTWTSSDTSVAKVDSNGKVTAVGGGKTKIRVKTKDGGYKAYCTVKVKVPVTGVSLSDNSIALWIDPPYSWTYSGKTLRPVFTPSDTYPQNVSCKSYDTSVATVSKNSDGSAYVKAVGKGTTKVRVKTHDGGYTAYCEVNVY